MINRVRLGNLTECYWRGQRYIGENCRYTSATWLENSELTLRRFVKTHLPNVKERNRVCNIPSG